MAKENSPLIHYIDIGGDSNTDLVRWSTATQNIFRLDILASRAAAKDSHYLRMEKTGVRTVFRKTGGITFIIAADESMQFQLLEAILDEVASDFFAIYGAICCDILTGMTNMFEGFALKIPELIERAQKENVIWALTNCKICGINMKICIKKALIKNAKDYPVALVYLHAGHGLLCYIDANFKVRGAEIVDISG